jgi:ribosomal-protein-alanine N-acetyltransferase
LRAHEKIETARLLLHRPTLKDVESIFNCYASDPDVTRYVAWPRHTSIADTEFFLKFSDHEWTRWPAGPYLVRSRADGSLLGSTGLAFESDTVASTGYVFAKDTWGHGYATESLRAMIALARELSIRRLCAMCHADHRASARVLEKGGLTKEGILPNHITFPNLGKPGRSDVVSYTLTFESVVKSITLTP